MAAGWFDSRYITIVLFQCPKEAMVQNAFLALETRQNGVIAKSLQCGIVID